ncbi:MAG: DUF4388 domain-containing protein [Desulfuromonadales bacterium]|nr:DUF4388 domain-containing protein [Desulfuromonadales bacterium]
MSLQGNLEHFPIIDVIQLLNGARKSGILRLSSAKGESQLVFHDGDLVSANYLNNRVRIGQVLLSAGAITEEQLARALDIQNNAGDDRKPLVITMLEHDLVDETAAYNGIESLIEMTIVEVLTWKEGQFSLEIARSDNTGSYCFSRTKFPQRILLNAQGILMESLRIFDEKVRDGTMEEILSIAGVSNLDLDAEKPGGNKPAISSGYDKEDVSSALQLLLDEQRTMIQRSSDQSYRTPDAVKKLILDEFPTAANDQKKQLFAFMAGSKLEESVTAAPPSIAVIVITPSEPLSTMVRSACSQQGVYAVSTDNIATLDINIRLLMCQTLHLVIFLDVPHDESRQDTVRICRELQKKYPQASLVLLACARFWDAQGLQALGSGVRSLIPRPCKECSEATAVQQALVFCSELGAFLRTLSLENSSGDDQRFFSCISRLCGCKTRSEISVAILEFLADSFERAIVFTVEGGELAAEHSFGVKGAKAEGITPLAKLRIPLDDQQVFEDIVKSGQMYYGFYSDSTCPHELYRTIGRPESPEILLFPFIRGNTVAAFIYADFGPEIARFPSLHFVEALQQYTTAQISVSAYRQKLKSIMDATAK